jgi:ribosomal protein S18 acetylase RimI-like enzyme
MEFDYQSSGLDAEEVYLFLTKCDKQFSPHLSTRVNLREYSEKLFINSTIIHVKNNDDLIGLIAFYMNNNSQGYSFISLICVLNEYEGKLIGSRLMEECTSLVKNKKIRAIKLEVDIQNQRAMTFYKKFGFIIEDQKPDSCLMIKVIT